MYLIFEIKHIEEQMLIAKVDGDVKLYVTLGRKLLELKSVLLNDDLYNQSRGDL